jgi:hypothetical protein
MLDSVVDEYGDTSTTCSSPILYKGYEERFEPEAPQDQTAFDSFKQLDALEHLDSLLKYPCTQPVPFANVDALKSSASTTRSDEAKKKRTLQQILEVLQRSDCTSFAEVTKQFDSWELRQILSAAGNPAAKSATKASCVESVVELYRNGALQSQFGTSFPALAKAAGTEGLVDIETQSQQPRRNVPLLYTATPTSAVPAAPGVVYPSSAIQWQPMEDGKGVVPKPYLGTQSTCLLFCRGAREHA